MVLILCSTQQLIGPILSKLAGILSEYSILNSSRFTNSFAVASLFGSNHHIHSKFISSSRACLKLASLHR
jgi:hypothetical protein